MLTDLTIRTAKSRENPYKLHDGEGLYLLIHPNGSKYWRFKYRFHGKEKLLALGVYPDVPLAKARERVQEARKLIADKTDPSEVRKREKRKARERACNTFEALGQEWFEQRKGSWSPNHAARVLASLQPVPHDLSPMLRVV